MSDATSGIPPEVVRGMVTRGICLSCAHDPCKCAPPKESPSGDKRYRVRSGNASVPELFNLPDAMAEAALQLARYGTVTVRESDFVTPRILERTEHDE